MKIDLKLSRSMTVPLKNYSNVKPEVTVTIKDIDVEKATEAFKHLSSIVDAMFMIELADELDTLNAVIETQDKLTLINSLKKDKEVMEDCIKEDIRLLKEVCD